MAAVIPLGQIETNVANHYVNSPSNPNNCFCAWYIYYSNYNAALELRHLEEAASVEAQHRELLSRRRRSMRSVVFANHGRWGREGRKEGQKVKLTGKEDM
ncbi:hypothetical protein BPOR_0326g00130 [Botrytis porri]|uniref:Uncharacterized protein n=1 Tax=Botrytis porri TaxID=87229 RepID=A0A4Z1KL21_9HELO|nr:hypothetical protein BPOR_0326g00130 [Botrytis porri]